MNNLPKSTIIEPVAVASRLMNGSVTENVMQSRCFVGVIPISNNEQRAD